MLAPIRVWQAPSSAALCEVGSWAERVCEAPRNLFLTEGTAEPNPRWIHSGSDRTMLGTPEILQQLGRSRTPRHLVRISVQKIREGWFRVLYQIRSARLDDHSLQSRITSIGSGTSRRNWEALRFCYPSTTGGGCL